MPLGEIVNLQRGYDLPSHSRKEGKIPIISSSGVTGFHNEARGTGEGVITGRYGTLGEVFFVAGEYWPLNTTLFVQDFKGNHPRFIFYLLKTLNLKEYNGAAAVPGLDRNVLHRIKCNLPTDLPTQRRIASILSAYDDLIENNLKRIKLLEEAAQNIYREWFVHFRFPGYERVRRGADGLPEGWRKELLGNLFEITSSKRIYLSDYVNEGVPFYRGKEIIQKSKYQAVSEPYFISIEKFNDLDTKFGSPQVGDLLITGVGTIGYAYLVSKTDGQFYFKDGNLIWLKRNNNSVSSYFTYQFFKSQQFINIVNSISIGSSQKALTIQALNSITFVCPPDSTIKGFDKILIPIRNQANALYEQVKLIEEARDILLPRLMNRTIEV